MAAKAAAASGRGKVAVINRSASKVPLPMMPAAASKSSQRYVVVPWRRIWYS